MLERQTFQNKDLVLKVSLNYDPNKEKKMSKKDYSNWTEEVLTAQIEEIEWHKI